MKKLTKEQWEGVKDRFIKKYFDFEIVDKISILSFFEKEVVEYTETTGEGNKQCEKCHTDYIMVEYSYDNPEHYDGISEYFCPDCKVRIGRWSGKTLKDGEVEKRYGK